MQNPLTQTIGIIGGGQLGKMMILDAKRLGFRVVILDPDPNCPASSISDEQIVRPFDDAEGYRQLAQQADVVTYEFEHIHVGVLEELAAQGQKIFPPVQSLKTIQNKFTQNQALAAANVPSPRFAKVESVADILASGQPDQFGYPMMLKATTGGYDGKGNALVRTAADAEVAFQSLGGGKIELMVEEFVDFTMEISILATRGQDGKRVIYPVAENEHQNSILHKTIVPARIDATIAEKAAKIGDKVMEIFEGVGTFCVEMFVTHEGDVLVNEIAPRPHNSGHYTIEACFASQFENHIRAVAGLPLGDVSALAPAAMINVLGSSDGSATWQGISQAYQDPLVNVHIYGKQESKTARKMGHITVLGDTVEEAIARADKAGQIVSVVGE